MIVVNYLMRILLILWFAASFLCPIAWLLGFVGCRWWASLLPALTFVLFVAVMSVVDAILRWLFHRNILGGKADPNEPPTFLEMRFHIRK